MNKKTVWMIIILEVLFGLCALSVLAYRWLGIAFDFGLFSYRVFNIVVSLGIKTYIALKRIVVVGKQGDP